MENQQWAEDYQESLVSNLERTDESLNNGICDNLLDNADNPAKTAVDASNLDGNSGDGRNVQVVEAAISEKSRHTIQNILDQVKTLSKIEKLLLYLKLPTENNTSIDPLRQPLNPLGSRAEIHRTISWIKTHLEEDPDISLPKQDVYEEYSNFCHLNKIKPLSQADFGKVMKQVYPKVRARRLGTRGNSRYCYSGLQRRHRLEAPNLPDLADKPLSTEPHCTQADLMAATWTVVKEWSENQLGNQFPSLQALACYLVLNLSVSSGSAAAALVTTVSENQLRDTLSADACSTKRREMQLQLQKKLQRKSECNREQKRKSQQQSPKADSKPRCKRSKLQPSQIITTSQSSASSSTSPVSVAAEPATGETNDTSPSQGPQSVCDKSLDYTNLQTLPDFSSFQKPAPCEGKGCVAAVTDYVLKDNEMFIGNVDASTTQKSVAVTGKMAIPRLSSGHNKILPPLSPKRVKNVKYKAIQPKPELCDIASYNPQLTLNVQSADSRSQTTSNTGKCKKQRKRRASSEARNSTVPIPEDETATVTLTRERLVSVSSVDKDAMDEYLGTSNSQEHEEELLKYFKNNNTVETNEPDNSTKLSQLRQLLEQNGIADTRTVKPKNEPNASENTRNANSLKNRPKTGIMTRSHPLIPTHLHNSTTRRRVSFETPFHHEDVVPPSPNTRQKHFSFTPISPGPPSPNGRQSKCSSTTASPFVSPRSTPVPRNRNQNNNQPVTNRQAAMFKKFKQVMNLSVDFEKDFDKDGKNFVTMSAPPSPMCPSKLNTNLLQKLLNSNDKVPYVPNYNQPQTPRSSDALSTEVSHFFASDAVGEVGYRSQSVPLHQMSLKSHPDASHSSLFSQFTFDLPANDIPPVGEFNDLESFSDTNINVNKIINALEEPPNEVILPENVFANVDMALTDNLVMPVVEQTGFGPRRGAERSQSVDVDFGGGFKFVPSRSVPNTPLPVDGKLGAKSLAQSSRSYPSTPLLAVEPFSYEQTHDYLLNGQPVKEKLVAVQGGLGELAATGMNDEIIYNNMEFYNINDVNLNNDVLIDNKDQFLSDDNFNLKRNDNCDGNCMVLPGEQNFGDNGNGM